MTQEGKAKAYDEVREKIAIRFGSNVAEEIFSEYEESEDERIRKSLINGFNKLNKSAVWYNGITNGQILAWLEKQGEHAKFRDSIQVGDKVTRNEDGVLVNLSQLNRVAKKDEKQGKNDMGISETTKRELEGNLNKALEKETPESCNEFLEKQSEQNPVVIIPKFRVGDEIETSNEESLTITKIDEKGYWSEDLFICGFDEECIWDLVGQKPAENVEPKYKVGDKVKSIIDGFECTIESIDDTCYYGDTTNFDIQDQDGWELVEQKFAWSEQDKEIHRKCICAMRASACGFPEEEKFVEQVDNWLKDLKERVLPQKQEWSEEDEQYLLICKNALAKYQVSDKWDAVIISQWLESRLKSLKPQKTWKPSDEQMKVLYKVLNFAANHENPHWNDYIFGTLHNLIRQLKKLMEK